MVCNWHVITCHYMHYMPLHAIEDANAELRDLINPVRRAEVSQAGTVA